ncbi:hypothetical protein T4B_693 [Trichinella pseudospiralis]|uniref:Uncharacterized protein n=1 Tax=Trichinella pseudospiralis TaxID=6337 RepID=A0A0V1KAJ7_TRIPS|nr:hypothetical protein T4B_693 [Trichinella pseudospiralis]KRZ44255.1 hypothetical protein T4C_8696 [Trichinella pseudospiralis]
MTQYWTAIESSKKVYRCLSLNPILPRQGCSSIVSRGLCEVRTEKPSANRWRWSIVAPSHRSMEKACNIATENNDHEPTGDSENAKKQGTLAGNCVAMVREEIVSVEQKPPQQLKPQRTMNFGEMTQLYSEYFDKYVPSSFSITLHAR